ncbi:alpha/beta fold hydrolase [Streptomyces sp. J2-1]|uniref:esterase/lipase family protein n=1 Tax=Streptomyces corallincola TaxID=2851888 RepID=UPI001C386E16|nr:alpha/beta fold hydrolase [Streptomyces corallincola]MBV2356568.1 alpha/beta fold hydrolase [Streptomyces corallincola]
MLPWKRVLRPLAALLLSAGVAVVPTASAHATTPHPASRTATAPASATPVTASAPAGIAAGSSGWNDWSCKPSAAHPRPVVLVHGTLGNSVDNWLGLAPYLQVRGYCVYSLDYGQLSGVPLFYGLGPVDKSAEQLSAFVDRVLASTGAAKADIVGHSQGGMMPRYYLKFLGGAAKVNALVGIAPSNHGATLSGLANLLPYFPGAENLIKSSTPALADQLPGSAFLTKLNAGGDTVPGVKYTVLATKYDEVATPWQNQYLSGSNVRNVLLQDLCALDLSEHLAIALVDRIAFHEVANALDPSHATTTNCASVFS